MAATAKAMATSADDDDSDDDDDDGNDHCSHALGSYFRLPTPAAPHLGHSFVCRPLWVVVSSACRCAALWEALILKNKILGDSSKDYSKDSSKDSFGVLRGFWTPSGFLGDSGRLLDEFPWFLMFF